MSRARKAAIGVGVLVTIGLLVAAYRPRPVPVDLARVARGPFQVVVEEDGRTRVKDRYVVVAPQSGELLRIELEAGDQVEEGAVLARIVPAVPSLLDVRTRSELESRLSAAEAALKQAAANVARVEASARFAENQLRIDRGLYEKGVVSRQQLDATELEQATRARELQAATFAVRVARYQADAARAALKIPAAGRAERVLEVRSPVRGEVLRTSRQSAGVVVAGAELLELGDPSALEVVVDVLTVDAVQVKPGDAVEIVRWGGERALRGRVLRVEPSGFTKTSPLGVEEQRVNVIVTLIDPASEWRTLGDGFRVEARIVTYHADNALVVPVTSLFRQGNDWAAYVVQEGRARLRQVQIARRGEREAQVASGLEAGEEVIVHPGDEIREGVAVTAR